MRFKDDISKLKEENSKEESLNVLSAIASAISEIKTSDGLIEAINSLEKAIPKIPDQSQTKEAILILQKIQEKNSIQSNGQIKILMHSLTNILKETERHNKKLESKISNSSEALIAIKDQMEVDQNAKWEFSMSRNKSTKLIEKVIAQRIT